MPLCLLGLGSNLGDSARTLDEALARLGRHPQVELLRQSRYLQTPPVGGPAGQADYLNAAALVRTSMSPHALLIACQEIENELGRRREVRWGPRTIDIDLLLYDDLVLNEPDLTIPHPRMAERQFALEPAAEIAREMQHPAIGLTVGQLLENLNGTTR
jgi:2-amino-4-hydroxy-6-hydroxymethyldihydropteridine diphosphokinase